MEMSEEVVCIQRTSIKCGQREGGFKIPKCCQRQISIIPKSTNESYALEIALLGGDNGNQVDVTITSDDYFGARHALETLFQG